jgi:Zn-dependent peptidase ImmA (M78 family)
MAVADFIVPPKSWDQIAGIADDFRQQLGIDSKPYTPVMEVIESVLVNQLELFDLEIDEQAELGAAEGFTKPDGSLIILREDVYIAACNGDGRARFTAAHELGHWLMHTNIPMARAEVRSIKPYLLAEPQANAFAAELLMPRRFLTSSDTAPIISERHGVSLEAAQHRISFLKKRGLI